MEFLKKNGLFLAWLISIAGTLTAFYFGEIKGYPICHFCWYQRICLFPLVILLGIGVYKNEKIIANYTFPIAVIGALLALYQYGLQMIPSLKVLNTCGTGPKCSDIHFALFGFITLPLLSFIAFIILAFLLYLTKKSH